MATYASCGNVNLPEGAAKAVVLDATASMIDCRSGSGLSLSKADIGVATS